MSIDVAKLPRVGMYLYIMCFMGRPNEPIGPVKIGITGNVQSRLSAVQTGCHQRLEVLAAFSISDRDSARRVEMEIHKLAGRWRLEGEWFEIDPIIALEVACGMFDLFLDQQDVMFPNDESLQNVMGRVGLLHFQSRIKELQVWRDHYAKNSNVTAMSRSA